jgi:putative ABC transport system permease protein
MRWFYKLPLRLRSLFGKQEADRELGDEFQFHLQCQIDEYVAQGMAPDDARYAALRSLGGMEQFKQECREMRHVSVIEHIQQDLRFGFRMLVRSPGFSLLAILCLTIGIGANAAVFSWIEGVLFRPYPRVAHQEQLMVLAGTARGTPGYNEVSWPDFLDYQKNCKLVDAVIAEKIVGTTLSIGDRAERAAGSIVSANYFDAIGVHPALGRGFTPDEDTGRNAHPVVVISHQLWQDRFHSDPAIIGKMQVLNGLPHTIVGVTPEGFYGTFVGYPFQFWVPASMQERFDSSGYKLEDRGARWVEGFVRLKPGVSAAQAQAEIAGVASRLELAYPETNRGRGIKLVPLWQSPFNSAGALLPTLGVALAVVFFVLLIACANVGNLMLVRSFARRQEMTIRLAIGADRRRLLKQLLTEGLILSSVAAVGGLLLAIWCRNALVRIIPPRGVEMRMAGDIDWRVLALSAAVCLISTLLFGLVPAIQSSKVDLAGALKSESGGVVSGRHGSWIRSSLVVLQVALSFILLVGAGLLIQSLQRIRSASPGFSTDGVVMTSVNLFAAGYDTPRARNFEDQLMDRVAALSGIESAAYARIAPFSYRTYSSAPIAVDGYEVPPDQQPTVEYNEVSPAYFRTLGIPLVSGRDFTRADDEGAPLVAIVNETMVAQYWRGENPVGKRLKVKDRWMQVAGVVKPAKYGNLMESQKPFFYVPLRQNPSTQVGLFVRTPQGPETIAPVLTREVHALDPALAPYEVITMRENVERSTTSQHVAVTLLSGFGGLALLLAGIGLYGVMSYAVSQSRRELGLRMALGATPSHLLRLVMSRGVSLTAGGVALGAGAALLLTRLLGYLLYKVSPRDPLSFALAFAVMIVAALAASLVPAWRATKTDPVRALRAE